MNRTMSRCNSCSNPPFSRAVIVQSLGGLPVNREQSQKLLEMKIEKLRAEMYEEAEKMDGWQVTESIREKSQDLDELICQLMAEHNNLSGAKKPQVS